jgi:hypothetical protein
MKAEGSPSLAFFFSVCSVPLCALCWCLSGAASGVGAPVSYFFSVFFRINATVAGQAC